MSDSGSSKAAMERELANKKAKLEELRRAKAARQQSQTQSGTDKKINAADINIMQTQQSPPHIRQQSAEVTHTNTKAFIFRWLDGTRMSQF